MKNKIKKKISEFICWLCEKLDIYIMVNIKLESSDSHLSRLTEIGLVKNCQFSGKIIIQ